jgi:hypothetical protein
MLRVEGRDRRRGRLLGLLDWKFWAERVLLTVREHVGDIAGVGYWLAVVGIVVSSRHVHGPVTLTRS